MKTIVLSIAAVFLLSGCGSNEYVQVEKNESEAQKAEKFCKYEALKATGAMNDRDAAEDEQEDLIEACMEMKGYATKGLLDL